MRCHWSASGRNTNTNTNIIVSCVGVTMFIFVCKRIGITTRGRTFLKGVIANTALHSKNWYACLVTGNSGKRERDMDKACIECEASMLCLTTSKIALYQCEKCTCEFIVFFTTPNNDYSDNVEFHPPDGCVKLYPDTGLNVLGVSICEPCLGHFHRNENEQAMYRIV